MKIVALAALLLAVSPPASFAPDGGELAVNVYTGSSQHESSLAVEPDGGVWVVWSGRGAGDPNGIYGRRFDAKGAPRGGELGINSVSATQAQSDPQIVIDRSGRLVVAWTSAGQDGDKAGVFARRFAADGTPLGADLGLTVTTDEEQTLSDLAALPNGGFVAVWGSDDGQGPGAWVRLFDAEAQPTSGEILVNTSLPHLQGAAVVAVAPEGGLVVAWHSAPTYSTRADLDGDGAGIFAQRLSPAGEKVGGEVRVNSLVPGDQLWPDIAMQSDGSYLVVWEGPEADGQGIGVFAQAFAADGSRRGGEQVLNEYRSGDQRRPRVAALASGGYAVAWASMWQDRDGEAVVGRVVGADGVPVGAEQILNETSTAAQYQSAIGATADGFVASWTSKQLPKNGNDLYLRRFVLRR